MSVYANQTILILVYNRLLFNVNDICFGLLAKDENIEPTGIWAHNNRTADIQMLQSPTFSTPVSNSYYKMKLNLTHKNESNPHFRIVMPIFNL